MRLNFHMGRTPLDSQFGVALRPFHGEVWTIAPSNAVPIQPDLDLLDAGFVVIDPAPPDGEYEVWIVVIGDPRLTLFAPDIVVIYQGKAVVNGPSGNASTLEGYTGTLTFQPVE